jgi:hypothetical protein
MSLAATALDQVPIKRGKLIDSSLSFLRTDTVWYFIKYSKTYTRSCRASHPPALAQIQSRHHDPLMRWFCKKFDVQLNLPKPGTNINDKFLN